MKKFLILGSSILLATLTTGAYAADPISAPEPAPSFAVPAFNWSGAYFGGQIDYSMMKGNFLTPTFLKRKALQRVSLVDSTQAIISMSETT